MYQEKKIITAPISNNRLNWDERENKSIIVPSMINGTLNDVQIGEEVVIESDVDGKIIAGKGLKNFVFLKNAKVPTWIMDNHNHAFAFWHEALAKGFIEPGSLLVHIDQHTDLGNPMGFPIKNAKDKVQNNENCSSSSDERNHCIAGLSEYPGIQENNLPGNGPFNSSGLDSTSRSPAHLAGMTGYPFDTLEEVENYTNSVLTIADFIVPALSTGLISEAVMVTGEERYGAGVFVWEDNKLIKKSSKLTTNNQKLTTIVDIDLDYFSQGFDEETCLENVQYWLQKADIITIATSPLFIDQEKALAVLKSLQKSLVAL